NDWEKHFKLMADIDLKDFGDSSFNLIGSESHPFMGVFDGNGHTISNLNYAVTGHEEPVEDAFIHSFGLFRHLDDPNAMIRDLRLVNPEIRPASTCEKRLWNVGALVGSLGSGFISNCSVEGGRVQGERGIGGLTGSNWGTITDCYTTCMVRLAEQRPLPTVNALFDSREFFGGLVGVNFREISNCHAVGEISGERTVGGLVGETYGRISNSWSGGDISGDYNIGGLIGMAETAQISNCYATGHVSGQRSVGGLVGSCFKDSSINSCYATGSVSAEQEAGGLVGMHEGTLSECRSVAAVSAVSDKAGGLVGLNAGKIFTSWAGGDVSGERNIGGLVGENRKWSQIVVGILMEFDGIVVDSYAKGDASGEDRVGGLIGTNSGTVLGSYSTGRVTGDIDFGGLVGINVNIPVLGSFWDIETSGLDTSSGGTGKTTAEMQTAGTFLLAGWDFADETEKGTISDFRFLIYFSGSSVISMAEKRTSSYGDFPDFT
ncbi:MAG: GLUG motif-containing protein, partial [Planctomycetota bacterium]